jgi:hypothetical protein
MAAVVTPAGKVSVRRLVSDIAAALGLARVMTRVEGTPVLTVAGEKALETIGVWATTVTAAGVGLPLPADVVNVGVALV